MTPHCAPQDISDPLLAPRALRLDQVLQDPAGLTAQELNLRVCLAPARARTPASGLGDCCWRCSGGSCKRTNGSCRGSSAGWS